MIRRLMALLMIAFMVSGFSWGRSDDEAQDTKESSRSAYTPVQTSRTSTAATRETVRSFERSEVSEVRKREGAGEPSSANKQFPTELLKSLASGDEEVRKARIESLKRLSEAMSKMNTRAQQQDN